jgi:hypothetical protein
MTYGRPREIRRPLSTFPIGIGLRFEVLQT